MISLSISLISIEHSLSILAWNWNIEAWKKRKYSSTRPPSNQANSCREFKPATNASSTCHLVCSIFFKNHDQKLSALGDKGLIARDVTVYYRSTPTNKPRRHQSNINDNQLHSKKRLFTNTM